MREIRPIGAEEAEPFLRLLCEVFTLDFERARGIFFNEPLFDLRRKWAMMEGGKPISILTTVPLRFGWGSAIGIAGVATRPELRGRGLAAELISAVLEDAESRGERAALLFARDERLYTRIGFRTLDSVVYARLKASPRLEDAEFLNYDEVRARYDAWSEAGLNRLRRDDARWAYWRWNLRTCAQMPGGYVCVEGNIVRECVSDGSSARWPVGEGCDWFGLRAMAAKVCAPIDSTRHEMHLMGRGLDEPPEMFLTDQF